MGHACLARVLATLYACCQVQASAQNNARAGEEWWMESFETTTIINCTTTAAADPFTVEVRHEWSPIGAQRFVELVKAGWFDGSAFFRCVEGFLTQFGISDDKEKKAHWRERGSVQDDPNLKIPITRGMVSFAGGGANSRGTQAFIAFKDLPFLGKSPWETPLGQVTAGMSEVVDKLYKGYGEIDAFNKKGHGVSQGKLARLGNEYLRNEFPDISYFGRCWVVKDTGPRMEAAAVAAAPEEEQLGGDGGGVDGGGDDDDGGEAVAVEEPIAIRPAGGERARDMEAAVRAGGGGRIGEVLDAGVDGHTASAGGGGDVQTRGVPLAAPLATCLAMGLSFVAVLLCLGYHRGIFGKDPRLIN